MKRNRRFSFPFLPLFAIVFVVVATFPTDLLASEIAITIKNNSDHDIDFGAYNGNDTVCLDWYKDKVFTVYKGTTKDIHCDGKGTGSCKLFGSVPGPIAALPVGILGKSTSKDAGCNHTKRVDRNTLLTCTWDKGTDHPRCS